MIDDTFVHSQHLFEVVLMYLEETEDDLRAHDAMIENLR